MRIAEVTRETDLSRTSNLALSSEPALIEKYAAIVEPIFEKIVAVTKESKKLSSLRNWLLPMLVNGQITVK